MLFNLFDKMKQSRDIERKPPVQRRNTEIDPDRKRKIQRKNLESSGTDGVDSVLGYAGDWTKAASLVNRQWAEPFRSSDRSDSDGLAYQIIEVHNKRNNERQY